MWESYALASGPEEWGWYMKILEAFPRGFSATYRDGMRLLIHQARLRITGMDAGVPRLLILDPYHSLEWDLLSTTANSDGSWTVHTESSGWLVWRPLTDREYEQARASLPWEDVQNVAPDEPVEDVVTGPDFPTLVMEHWQDLGDVRVATDLFLEDDPMTGEVYPLRKPLLVLHCDAYNKKLGLWQMSEEQQTPLYPDTDAGREACAHGWTSITDCKGRKASWASVVDRLTRSMDITYRWYALQNPDNLTLREMFDELAIGQGSQNH